MKTKLSSSAKKLLAIGLCSSLLFSAVAQTNTTAGKEESGDDMAEIAKKLNNPVASLISVPLQNNFDFGGGPNDDGFQYKLNLQPVIPISLSDEWNLITRTIVPFIYQEKRIGNT